MTASTDGRALTEGQICELAGVSHQRRKTWVRRELLRRAPTRGCLLGDALSLAQLRQLIEVLGPTDGTAAWQQTRAEIEASSPGEVIDVLFDIELKQASVQRRRDEVGDLITHGRPVRVVSLGQRSAEISSAFERLWTAIETRSARDA